MLNNNTFMSHGPFCTINMESRSRIIVLQGIKSQISLGIGQNLLPSKARQELSVHQAGCNAWTKPQRDERPIRKPGASRVSQAAVATEGNKSSHCGRREHYLVHPLSRGEHSTHILVPLSENLTKTLISKLCEHTQSHVKTGHFMGQVPIVLKSSYIRNAFITPEIPSSSSSSSSL